MCNLVTLANLEVFCFENNVTKFTFEAIFAKNVILPNFIKKHSNLTIRSHFILATTSISQFFETWKTAALPLNKFDYAYNGQKFTCESKECLLTTDQFNTYPDYGLAFWFLTISMVTPDGKTLGVVMQDGIGSGYSGRDRATEDHINYNGKVHKLDMTVVEFDADNLMNPIRANTVKKDKKFENNSCSLIFSPKFKD